jgi:hypothetical protein
MATNLLPVSRWFIDGDTDVVLLKNSIQSHSLFIQFFPELTVGPNQFKMNIDSDP